MQRDFFFFFTLLKGVVYEIRQTKPILEEEAQAFTPVRFEQTSVAAIDLL